MGLIENSKMKTRWGWDLVYHGISGPPAISPMRYFQSFFSYNSLNFKYCIKLLAALNVGVFKEGVSTIRVCLNVNMSVSKDTG